MPKVRRSRKKPPEGWDLIEPTLDELDGKLREVESETHEGKRRVEALWPIFKKMATGSLATAENTRIIGCSDDFDVLYLRSDNNKLNYEIHHQKSRYIYDLFFKRKAISRELYQFCINENIADAALIAKWKKPGYENLCCLRCIQPRDTNFGTACICRVPKSKLETDKITECVHCGCRGCSG